MPLLPLTFGSQSNPARYGLDGGARIINAMLEEAGPDAKAPVILYPVDGLLPWAAAVVGAGLRGLFATERYLFAVAGQQIIRYDVNAGSRVIGYLPGTGPVYFARNRRVPFEIAAVSGGAAAIIRENEATQLLVGAPIDAGFVDGYTLLAEADGTVRWSAVDDAITYADGDFFSASFAADGLQRVMVLRREVWLFGTRTIEVWVPTGQDDQAFDRLGGGIIERGCLAPASVAKVEERLIWLADDGTVRVASGYQAERISTHAVERTIAAEVDRSAIMAATYSLGGHSHYVMSGAAFTWVFDMTTRRWTERASSGAQRWRVGTVADFAGKAIAGDRINGRLYEITPAATTENGEPVIMTLRSPPAHAWPEGLSVFALWLDVVPGPSALAPGAIATAEPAVTLRWSDDGGATWSTPRTAPVGIPTGRQTRVRFNRLGLVRNGRVFEVTADARFVRAIIDAKVQAEKVAA
jgi:hypothetical protein